MDIKLEKVVNEKLDGLYFLSVVPDPQDISRMLPSCRAAEREAMKKAAQKGRRREANVSTSSTVV